MLRRAERMMLECFGCIALFLLLLLSIPIPPLRDYIRRAAQENDRY